MNDNVFVFLLKYSSPESILVVTEDDKLIELKCPFRVKVIKKVENMVPLIIKEVSQVKLATNFKLVYIIEKKPYYYHYFDIII